MLLFRKSDDFFGLRSEKVTTFLDYVPKKFGDLRKKYYLCNEFLLKSVISR